MTECRWDGVEDRECFDRIGKFERFPYFGVELRNYDNLPAQFLGSLGSGKNTSKQYRVHLPDRVKIQNQSQMTLPDLILSAEEQSVRQV